MMNSRTFIAGLLMTSLLTGCNESATKLSTEEQKELIHLREEKKAWESEKRQMTETLELNKKDKDASLETMTRLQAELTLCQEKLKSVLEDKTVTNPKK
jgi:hypothetical protein